MRTLIASLAIAAVGALASQAQAQAQAQNGCDGPKTGFDAVYCFARVYMELDGQLNANYRALLKQVSSPQAIVLRQGQRNWMAMRDRTCLDAGGEGYKVNINCAIGTTRRRVQFLSDRIAECRANGCRMTLLGTVN